MRTKAERRELLAKLASKTFICIILAPTTQSKPIRQSRQRFRIALAQKRIRDTGVSVKTRNHLHRARVVVRNVCTAVVVRLIFFSIRSQLQGYTLPHASCSKRIPYPHHNDMKVTESMYVRFTTCTGPTVLQSTAVVTVGYGAHRRKRKLSGLTGTRP